MSSTFNIGPNATATSTPEQLAQAGADSVDFQIIQQGIAGNGVLSGLGITASGTANLTVAAGAIALNGLSHVTTGTTTVTITSNGAANPRWDLVIFRVGTGPMVLTGTPTAAPYTPFPAPTWSTDVVLGSVYMAPGASVVNTADLTPKAVIPSRQRPGVVNVLDFGADPNAVTVSPTGVTVTGASSTTAFQNAYNALPTITLPSYQSSTNTYINTTVPWGKFEIPAGNYFLDATWNGEDYDFGPFVEVEGTGGRGSVNIYPQLGGNHVGIQATNAYIFPGETVGDNPGTNISPQGYGGTPTYGLPTTTWAPAISVHNIKMHGDLLTCPITFVPNYNNQGIIVNTPTAFLFAGGESAFTEVTVMNWNFPTYGMGVGIALQGYLNGPNSFANWMESSHHNYYVVNADVPLALLGNSNDNRSFNDTHIFIRLHAYPGQNGVVMDSGALAYHSEIEIHGKLEAQLPISKITIPGTPNQSYSPGTFVNAYSPYPIPAYYNGMQVTVGNITGLISGALDGAPPHALGYQTAITPLTLSSGHTIVATGTVTVDQTSTFVCVTPAGPLNYQPHPYGLSCVQLGIGGGGGSGFATIHQSDLVMELECDPAYMNNKNPPTLTSPISPGTYTSLPVTSVNQGIAAGTSFQITGDPNNNIFVISANAPSGTTTLAVESIVVASTIPNTGSNGQLNCYIPTGAIPGTIFIDDNVGCAIHIGTRSHLDFGGGGITYHGLRMTSKAFTGGAFTCSCIVAGDVNIVPPSGVESFVNIQPRVTALPTGPNTAT
jgi:hypothetical protein